MKKSIIVLTCQVLCVALNAQETSINDNYLRINARGDDPLYTTYAAAMNRSRLYGDKAYKMDYYSADMPLNYSSDQSGRIYNIWMINKVVVDRMSKYHKKPVIVSSFPDMVISEYQPWEGISVKETFLVYSSTIALVELEISNLTSNRHRIDIFPTLEIQDDSLRIEEYRNGSSSYILNHTETKKRLISNLRADAPYPTNLRDIFSVDFTPYSYGGYNGNLDLFYPIIKTDYYSTSWKKDSLNMIITGLVDRVSFHGRFNIEPGKKINVRFFRGIQEKGESGLLLTQQISKLKSCSLQPFIEDNKKLFSAIPRIEFKTNDEKLIYMSTLNLARGCMLPSEGKTTHNYYVFSRNPLWGWGHGHQVLHESLAMLAYVYLDPKSAEGSQRVYLEQQGKDGLIAYRHGPRGMQDYPHKGMSTTSAPFYTWINWEVYNVSRNRKFLEEMYTSGVAYLNWLLKNRDKDKDGLFEWGPYGLIENVRDWYNVIFQVSEERHLDIDKEDISDDLECLDLTLMMINEMRYLSKMANELGKTDESKKWTKLADKTSILVNRTMWDEETGFYYHVDGKNHTFKFLERDLRHQEIIAFLALWAEVVPKDRADRLIKSLVDTTKFWRKYGVPTLSADDDFYTPYVDYCCKWNGPVWLLWNYMVYDGLKKYGYNEIASELAKKMVLAVSTQLKTNHNFWESYSPDNDVLDCPSNYIWDAIMARVLIEENRK